MSPEYIFIPAEKRTVGYFSKQGKQRTVFLKKRHMLREKTTTDRAI
jgi:hypothetical protein